MTNLNTMRVAHKMAEARVGRWRLRHFTRTAEEVAMEQLKIRYTELPERRPFALRRIVPTGTYVSLQRRMIEQEMLERAESEFGDLDRFAEQLGMTADELIERTIPDDARWIPVMSDTPAEINEHASALNMHGRILITGLGLGCVIQGLLAKGDEVERIDVIEIDPDVIELTGHYHTTDPRVHIWHGSAIDPSCLPSDLRWDFAWHDIWTHIADRNLDAATAEHGISYDRVFNVWDERVEITQDAWALDVAQEMLEANERMRQQNIKWYEKLMAANIDRQVEMLQDKVIWERQPELHGRSEAAIRRAFDPTGDFAAHLKQRIIGEPDFLTGLGHIAESSLESDEPLGRPNEEASL